MFQLIPVFLGLFDSTVQKLMNGFRDIFYELAYSNLSNMLSDLNEKVGTISTELSTAPDAWQGGTIWSLIVKIAEQVALPVAGTVFTFVILWELISMLIQPNNLADVDFVSVLMKWLIKSVVAAWFISNSLTICNCFFGVGASMVSKTTTVLNQQVTDNTQDSVLLKYLSDNYGDQDEDAESGDVSGLISLTVSTWFIDIIIKVMGILITISALASLLSSAGADSSEDIAKYPVWLAIIAFAIVPAVVEEYVFRGLILGAYMKVDARAAVVISSLFFAMLHFSLGSILYGFFYGCVFALIRIATGNMMYGIEL